MKKTAYIRTLEAFTAILVTFIFIVAIGPVQEPSEEIKEELEILSVLSHDTSFRNNALLLPEESAEGNITEQIRIIIPGKYEFLVDVQGSRSRIDTLPEKQVYVESVFITGNLTVYDPKIIRLYYWRK